MARRNKIAFTDDDDALLSELGVEVKVTKATKYTAKEERVIAGFEEIQRFVAEYDRVPEHGEEKDIFERLYAVRLEQISKSNEFVDLLREMDQDKLLTRQDVVKEDEENYEINNDEELLEALGVGSLKQNGLTQLKHVRSRAEIKAAEEIARRQPCEDFDTFRTIFDKVQSELDSGLRITRRYLAEGAIELGDLFVVEGNKVIVVHMGEEFLDGNNRADRRLRVVYDNGTESNLLLRSLQKALWRDPVGRRIMGVGHDPYPLFSELEPDTGAMFLGEAEEDDETSGYLYVLRSLSEHPFVAGNRDILHKIGFTRGTIDDRFKGASSEPTFLKAGVKVVATYRIANASAGKLENVLHRFFSSARVDVKLREEVGGFVEPREWFLVPLAAIQDAISLVKSGEIEGARYEIESAKVVIN